MGDSVTIEDIYRELKKMGEKMVTREDIEALIDSVEILSNPKTMEALRKSDRDIKSGRVREITSVKDLLDVLNPSKPSERIRKPLRNLTRKSNGCRKTRCTSAAGFQVSCTVKSQQE